MKKPQSLHEYVQERNTGTRQLDHLDIRERGGKLMVKHYYDHGSPDVHEFKKDDPEAVEHIAGALGLDHEEEAEG